MRTRIITALVALAVLAPFVIFSGTFMLEIFTIVLSVVAVYEVLKCAGLERKPLIYLPAYAAAFCMPLAVRHIDFASGDPIKAFFVIFFILMVYYMVLAVFSRRKLTIEKSAFIYAFTFYIVFSFNCIILLRDMKYGEYIYMLVFLGAWLTDVGAYFVGVLFGRHKLIEEVSPKKTIEGSVGGIVFGALSFAAFGFAVGLIFDVTPRYIPLIIVGIVTSVISQCGDLIASLVKREYSIKDYGYVFPGHGGVLDRFDSIIATAPFLYFLCTASSYFELFF